MNRILRFAMLTVSALAVTSGAALADYELNILHINDLHSRIESINKFDSTCSAEDEGKGECFGGVARVKSAIDARRSALQTQNANVLVLDAGDQFQGSLFYTTYKSEAVAEFMNAIGFDAMAVGNHEFDDGPEELAKLIAAAKFPIISGNTVAGANTPVGGGLKGYIVKELGGQKIGIVSVLATDTDETSSPGPAVFFVDEVQYLKDAVKELEAQGVNKIVLLSHVGYPRDKEIAAAVDGIDVIVGGHSHTLLSNTEEGASGPYPTLVKNPSGADVPIVTAYAYSKYLGDIKIVFDDAGKVKTAEGAPQLLDASVKPDEAVAARVTELAKPLEELKARVIGESAETIDGDRKNCRAKECTMGNLVAEAMLDRVKDQGVTIAVQNGGGVRASIDAGPVTMGEVLTVLPFQNTVATFQITGADLVEALENGLSQLEEGAGRFPQVAGMKYSFDPKKPAGSRVISAEVMDGGKMVALDPAKTYGVVTNNYVRGGGDGYKVFAEKAINAYDFGPSLEDVTAAYIGKNSPYKPFTDDRITIVDSAVAATETPAETPAEPATAEPATAEPAAEAKSDVATGSEVTTPDLPAAATDIANQPPVVGQESSSTEQSATQVSQGSDAAETVSSEQKHTLVSGDNFWDLAERFYGNGAMWKKISEANSGLRPRALPVGREITVPAK